ncbi:methionyl-tRNA formyltransferase [Gammaproteobacteria bacterium LSUCC0112]|nr:methionyl-tRNA formyltransferase [Gammaproteobacteria bacterium LSUCC0112]
MPSLGIVFAGTPAFAAKHLQALLDAGHNIVAVYTQPDRAAGRGKNLQASPVKQLALVHNIPVLQPENLKITQAQQELASLGADLMVVVAYGLLLPQAVLDIPPRGCINVHASVLPRWRGAAPIERALLAGDTETGVTIMQMDAGLDTGNMLHIVKTPISATDDRETLENKLAEIGCRGLLHTLKNLDTLQSNAQHQNHHESTYAKKLEKAEALIDWNASSTQIDLLVRAGIGRNPAYSFLNGQRIRVLKARPTRAESALPPGTVVKLATGNHASMHVSCGSGILEVELLQLPGKNPVSVKDLLNANNPVLIEGAVFNQHEST